ncbi:MAG TPA: HDOD domain-containing protein [Acidimicrobiales bacterium]|nr:HDOD domain-containing protein [Acidimicrobiales bacterium]
MAILDVLVGRQPIFDRDLKVAGHELLFRPLDTDATAFGIDEDDQITPEAVFASTETRIDRLVGKKKLFCNAGPDVLTGGIPISLPPERTVVEVVGPVRTDELEGEGCRRLVEDGFTLALGDFAWFEGAEDVLAMASYVKLDLHTADPERLGELLGWCRQFDVALVAEKVETMDELHWCDSLGFDFFQGYLLSRPRIAPGRALDPGRLARLRMAAKLMDAECPLDEIEEIVRTDPAMTHQLLQLAGVGAARGMRRKVRTIHEALVLVGWRRLQSWISLLLVTDKGRTSEEEIIITLVRARMAELIAQAAGSSLAGVAFTASMLSCLDVLLGVPLPEVLRELPLDHELRDAVLRGEGVIGRLVFDVADYQLGRPEEARRSGLGEHVLQAASLEALTWALEMTAGFEQIAA